MARDKDLLHKGHAIAAEALGIFQTAYEKLLDSVAHHDAVIENETLNITVAEERIAEAAAAKTQNEYAANQIKVLLGA